MKKTINEIAKFQRLAGLITESEYQEIMMKDEEKVEEVEKVEEISGDAYKRMSGLVKTDSAAKMIEAAEDMMNDLTEEGFEVDEIREFFTQLIANDI